MKLMPDREMVWPPDDEWVPFALPMVEGRCIPEKRMSLKDGKWIFEYRYPKPCEESDDEDDEPEDDMVPVVRCKYCKHRLECDYWIENGDYWFCADGERGNLDA